MEKWITRIKVLALSAIFISVGNWINSWRQTGTGINPLEVLPALGFMMLIIILGLLLMEFISKYLGIKLPSILVISLIAVFMSIPGFSPFADYIKAEFSKIGALPLCTPILAYAGISIGKDLDGFKQQGVAIICVALLTFIGTYIGSAIIAQVVLTVTGAI